MAELDDEARRKRKTQLIGAGVVAFLVSGSVLAFAVTGDEEEQAPQSKLGESDAMLPEPEIVQAPTQGGRLILIPDNVQFEPGQENYKEIAVRAVGAPVEIGAIQQPTGLADIVSVENISCPESPAQIPAGTSCQLAVRWNGVDDVNTTAAIETITTNTGSSPVRAKQVLAVSAYSVSDEVSALPVMTPAAPGAAEPAPALPASPPVPAGPSPEEQRRDAYADARRGNGGQVRRPQQLQPVAVSPYASWNEIGVASTMSSAPTDMTRVLTPDKPISAVLSVPIDTRQAVTAVAMADRDVYGNNGRTVVIPRGSKLIGQVINANERVGIAWRQLIRPDGARFVFEALSGDAMGRGGVPGNVNERNTERYGYSLLTGLAEAGITVGLGGQSTTAVGGFNTQQTQDAGAVASEAIREQLRRISDDFFARKSRIPIQITVPTGTRMTVWSLTDLRLRPAGEEGKRQAALQAEQEAELFARRGSGAPSFRQTQVTSQQTAAQPDVPEAQQNYRPSGMAVGTVDASGNYVPPGSSAPRPGPMNRSQPLQPAAERQSPEPQTNTQAPWVRN